jgi:hypothetical protein
VPEADPAVEVRELPSPFEEKAPSEAGKCLRFMVTRLPA